MKKPMIFDLGGTLLNTIADLAHSTNHALQVLGYPTREIASYNFVVSNGINKLLERALPEREETEKNVPRVRKKFLLHYDRHNTNESRPYPGVPELLEALRNKGHKLAMASSKYQAATEKLIAHYFLGMRFVAIFGQREGVEVKPDPTVVYDILQIADVPREGILYIGDSEVDMQAAINSRVTSCGVTWGFRLRTELESFCPDFIVNETETVLSIV